QGLEDALRGVSGALRCRRSRRLQQIDEILRADQWSVVSRLDDETCVAGGELLLAVTLEDAAEIALTVRGEHLGRSSTRGLVHAHVQRCVLRVCEPALGLVQLQ